MATKRKKNGIPPSGLPTIPNIIYGQSAPRFGKSFGKSLVSAYEETRRRNRGGVSTKGKLPLGSTHTMISGNRGAGKSYIGILESIIHTQKGISQNNETTKEESSSHPFDEGSIYLPPISSLLPITEFTQYPPKASTGETYKYGGEINYDYPWGAISNPVVTAPVSSKKQEFDPEQHKGKFCAVATINHYGAEHKGILFVKKCGHWKICGFNGDQLGGGTAGSFERDLKNGSLKITVHTVLYDEDAVTWDEEELDIV